LRCPAQAGSGEEKFVSFADSYFAWRCLARAVGFGAVKKARDGVHHGGVPLNALGTVPVLAVGRIMVYEVGGV
jgi:hypothetical protein